MTRLLTGRGLRSDWMAVERERGISVSSAVMSFEHEGLAFNLLDTPGPKISFQQGHLPRPDRGPPTLPSPARGRTAGEGAERSEAGEGSHSNRMYFSSRARHRAVPTASSRSWKVARSPSMRLVSPSSFNAASTFCDARIAARWVCEG